MKKNNYGRAVLDTSPWPNGKGFSGATLWWDYVLSRDEQGRLENLIGLALLNEDVQHRLLDQRDPSLLAAFELSPETCCWLATVEASSLTELAQAILAQRQTKPLAA